MRAKAAGIAMGMYTSLRIYLDSLRSSCGRSRVRVCLRYGGRRHSVRYAAKTARRSQRSQPVRTGLQADRRLFGSEVTSGKLDIA